MRNRLNKLRSQLTANTNVLKNFSFLTILQFFNLLVPLLTYPYLIKVLGTEVYGKVIFAQVVVSYFSLIIDFGFRVSATKEISIHRDDHLKVSEIVSSVLFIKFFLWLICLIILSLCWWLGLIDDVLLYMFTFLICFNELLFPQWYFHGVEKMQFITISNISVRLLFVLLIFCYVTKEEDYLYVPLFSGIGAILGGIFGLVILLRKHRTTLFVPSFQVIKNYFNDSVALFFSNALISVKDRFSVFFIGNSLGMSDVALFDFSSKIMNLFFQPIDSINAAIYPKMAREKNMKFLFKISGLVFAFLCFLILMIQPFLADIVSWVNPEFKENLNVLRIMLISPLIMVWSLAIARNCLLVYGKNKLFSFGMFLTSLFYLFLIGLAYLFNLNSHLIIFGCITVAVYIFELAYRVFIVKKERLL